MQGTSVRRGAAQALRLVCLAVCAVAALAATGSAAAGATAPYSMTLRALTGPNSADLTLDVAAVAAPITGAPRGDPP